MVSNTSLIGSVNTLLKKQHHQSSETSNNMTALQKRDRRASAPAPAAKLPQLRLPTLPTDKEQRGKALDAFLDRVRVAKGRKYHYTLHEWWHTPLPKSKDDAKGSLVTPNVLQKVMNDHFKASHHQEMMDMGYASKELKSVRGKRYLMRLIYLPQVLRFLVVEKSQSLKDIAANVPLWKSRYARYVSIGSCDGVENPIQPVEDHGDEDVEECEGELVSGSALDDVVVELSDSEQQEALDVGTLQESANDLDNGSHNEEVAASSFFASSFFGSRAQEPDGDEFTLSNAASRAVLGSARGIDIENQLTADITRTPESVRKSTRERMEEYSFARIIASTISMHRMQVCTESQKQFSAFLASVSNGSVANLRMIYSSWGDSKMERNRRLCEKLLEAGLRKDADLLVAVASTWLNQSSKSTPTPPDVSGFGHPTNVPGNLSRSDNDAINQIENLEERGSDEIVKSDMNDQRRGQPLQGSNFVGDAAGRKRRKTNHNNLKSLLLVLFYTRSLGLAENIEDEKRVGISRSFCSGTTLEELCARKIIPLSRSMAFNYKSVGEAMLKAGKEKSIRKFEKRELLRLLLSDVTSDEVLKQEEVGGKSKDFSIAQKVLMIFDLDINLLENYLK